MEYTFNIIKNKGRVKSSNVKGYRYDTVNQTLIIEFNDGSKYMYEFVEFSEFEAIAKGDAICTTTGSNQYGSWYEGKTPSVGAAIWRWLIRKGVWYTKMFSKNMKYKKIDTDKLPVYELTFAEESSDETGISLISIVDNPAIEMKGFAFSNEAEEYEFKKVEDKQMIVGPAMIPNKKILQEDDKNGLHYVMFTKETIAGLVEKFNRFGSNRKINFEHTNQMVDAFIVEDWIVEDEVYDKSRKYGFEVPVGTYMIKVKIDNPDQWQEYVKEGGAYGFSIQGQLYQKLVQMSKPATIDDLELEDLLEIFDIKNNN